MDRSSFVHYRTDIEKIDHCHWAMITVMNRINALAKEHNYDECLLLTNNLQTMLFDHCIKEEKFMEEIGFPYLKAHVMAHAELIGAMVKLKKNIETHKYIHKDIASELLRIFVTHIDHHDMQYADWFKKHGSLAERPNAVVC